VDVAGDPGADVTGGAGASGGDSDDAQAVVDAGLDAGNEAEAGTAPDPAGVGGAASGAGEGCRVDVTGGPGADVPGGAGANVGDSDEAEAVVDVGGDEGREEGGEDEDEVIARQTPGVARAAVAGLWAASYPDPRRPD